MPEMIATANASPMADLLSKHSRGILWANLKFLPGDSHVVPFWVVYHSPSSENIGHNRKKNYIGVSGYAALHGTETPTRRTHLHPGVVIIEQKLVDTDLYVRMVYIYIAIYIYTHIYIYICIYRERERPYLYDVKTLGNLDSKQDLPVARYRMMW